MHGHRIRRGLLVAGGALAVLVPADAASAACVARPLASKTIGSTPTTTVLSLPGFLRATLVCSTVRGQKGLRGIRGVAGSTGARGRPGAIGAVGAKGLIGATGLQGLVGTTGPIGLQGLAGTTGSAGPPGIQGVPGTPGTPGAPGAPGARGLIGYASIYSEGAQSVAVEGPVIFSAAGTMTSGFAHTAGTAELTVATGGVYEIRSEVVPFQASQLALFVNGVVVPGSTFGNPNASQNSGQAIVALNAGDVVTLRNHTSAGALSLLATSGGTATNENASLLIEQLA
jgi:hypothetical protein